jgi:molybdopterin converting factor small subunit
VSGPVTMKISVLLRPISGSSGLPEVDVIVPEAATLGILLEHLCEQHPELDVHIRDGGGITDYITIFVNGQQAPDLGTAVGPGDQVLILFPVGGG